MSMHATEEISRAERAVFAALFVVLLAMALVWPAPVSWLNDVTIGAKLNISSSWSLGREAPSWDVVYWGIVGLAVLALLHGRLENVRLTWSEVRPAFRSAPRELRRGVRRLSNRRTLVVAVLLTSGVAAVWGMIDAPLVAQVERVGSPAVHDYVRISNRLGGGGNPPMIAGFFVLGGLALRRRDWVMLGTAMAISAVVVGILASALKPLVARSRPDVWLGPFDHAWRGESSRSTKQERSRRPSGLAISNRRGSRPPSQTQRSHAHSETTTRHARRDRTDRARHRAATGQRAA